VVLFTAHGRVSPLRGPRERAVTPKESQRVWEKDFFFLPSSFFFELWIYIIYLKRKEEERFRLNGEKDGKTVQQIL
jgi:hypothetical protein